MIEYCLIIPAGYFFYYIFSDENKGEQTEEGRRYGKEIEIWREKKIKL